MPGADTRCDASAPPRAPPPRSLPPCIRRHPNGSPRHPASSAQTPRCSRGLARRSRRALLQFPIRIFGSLRDLQPHGSVDYTSESAPDVTCPLPRLPPESVPMENAASSPLPIDPSPDAPPSVSRRASKWLKFILRWGIAVVGIVWVVNQMSFWDKILVLNSNGIPRPMTLTDPNATENQSEYRVVGRDTPVPRSETVNKADRKKVLLDGERAEVPLLGVDLSGNLDRNPQVRRLLIQRGDKGEWITPNQVAGGSYKLKVPYPRVDVGVAQLVRHASEKNLWLLLLAIIIFPLTYILTSFRWHELLKALDIHIGLMRTFTLNMVGAFYNTFMPGSTGGGG